MNAPILHLRRFTRVLTFVWIIGILASPQLYAYLLNWQCYCNNGSHGPPATCSASAQGPVGYLSCSAFGVCIIPTADPDVGVTTAWLNCNSEPSVLVSSGYLYAPAHGDSLYAQSTGGPVLNLWVWSCDNYQLKVGGGNSSC